MTGRGRGVTCDTSVVVAAASPWHPEHGAARAAMQAVEALVPHVLTEAYSVLTRLPDPHRIAPRVAGEWVVALAGARSLLALSSQVQVDLIAAFARTGVSGGAVYDALIGATAQRHDLGLLSLDQRARRTYELVGVRATAP